MLNCPRCGFTVAEQTRLCPRCGLQFNMQQQTASYDYFARSNYAPVGGQQAQQNPYGNPAANQWNYGASGPDQTDNPYQRNIIQQYGPTLQIPHENPTPKRSLRKPLLITLIGSAAVLLAVVIAIGVMGSMQNNEPRIESENPSASSTASVASSSSESNSARSTVDSTGNVVSLDVFRKSVQAGVFVLQPTDETVASVRGLVWSRNNTVEGRSGYDSNPITFNRSAGDELIIRGDDNLTSEGVVNAYSVSDSGYCRGIFATVDVIDEVDGEEVTSDNLARNGLFILDTATGNCLATHEKNREITFGYYSGTRFIEDTKALDQNYYVIDCQNPIECPLQSTKEGYFIINTASLAPGLYLFQDGSYGLFPIEVV